MSLHSRLDGVEPEVRGLVEQVLDRGAGAVAAFDADGTLWPGDIGEDFLRMLGARRLLAGPVPDEAYSGYERLFASDPAAAFAYCVEVMRGLGRADVERWSRELFAAEYRARVFPGMARILELFGAAGVEVFLVSASNAFTVRVAAAELGIPADRVLAVDCAVDGRGCLTGEVSGPVTCAAGKVEALQRALGTRRPAIAFGNSLFDREMLEYAERAVLVAPRGSGSAAVQLAQVRGWAVHRVGP